MLIVEKEIPLLIIEHSPLSLKFEEEVIPLMVDEMLPGTSEDRSPQLVGEELLGDLELEGQNMGFESPKANEEEEDPNNVMAPKTETNTRIILNTFQGDEESRLLLLQQQQFKCKVRFHK